MIDSMNKILRINRMNDYIPHILLGILATNVPNIQALVSYFVLVFILSIDSVQAQINLPSFAAKDTPTQIHHFIAFILGRVLGFLIKKVFKL